MRRLAWLLLILATPAAAQSGWGPGTPAARPDAAAPPAGSPAGGDAGAVVQPLPVPELSDNATPQEFIRDAVVALAAGRDGEAQEAIERAEARLLDRDVDPRRVDDPSRSPEIKLLAEARTSLSSGDRLGAIEQLQRAQARLEGRPDIRSRETGTAE